MKGLWSVGKATPRTRVMQRLWLVRVAGGGGGGGGGEQWLLWLESGR